MKNFKKTLLATTAALSIISFSAQASEGKQEWAYKKEQSASSSKFYVTGGAAYVKGKGKYTSTGHEFADPESFSTKFHDAEYNLGVGYYINENVRADINLNYMPKTKLEDDNTKISTRGAMANGYYHFPVGYEYFSPYTTVGLGYTKNKISNPSVNYTTNSFAWQVGGGISGPLSEKLSWDVGYRYNDKGNLVKSSNFSSSSLTSHSVLLSIRASL